MYRTLVIIIAASSAAAVASYRWQEARYERKLSDQEAYYLKRDFKALEHSHAETIRLQQAKAAAELKAILRERAAAADVANLRESVGRLSDTADKTLSDAEHTLATCTAHAATITGLFKDCAGRYSWMGEQAQGWLNEATTLRDMCTESLVFTTPTGQTDLQNSRVQEPVP